MYYIIQYTCPVYILDLIELFNTIENIDLFPFNNFTFRRRDESVIEHEEEKIRNKLTIQRSWKMKNSAEQELLVQVQVQGAKVKEIDRTAVLCLAIHRGIWGRPCL